jgi:choline dehydrogenase-like flavoprotein
MPARAVDASVFPVTIAAHFQVCIYALAEQAADISLEAHPLHPRLHFIKCFLEIKLLKPNEKIIASNSK